MFETKNLRIMRNQYFEKILRKNGQNFTKYLKSGHKNLEKAVA